MDGAAPLTKSRLNFDQKCMISRITMFGKTFSDFLHNEQDKLALLHSLGHSWSETFFGDRGRGQLGLIVMASFPLTRASVIVG